MANDSILNFLDYTIDSRCRFESTKVFMWESAETATRDFRIAIRMRKHAHQEWLVGLIIMLKTRVSAFGSKPCFSIEKRHAGS
jgi:hypothetical protein